MSIWKAIWVTVLFTIITYIVLILLLIPKFYIDFKNIYYYFLITVEILTHLISFYIIQKLFIKKSIYGSLTNTSIPKKYLLILLIITIGEILLSKLFIDLNDFIFSIPRHISSHKNYPPLLYFLLKIIKGCILAPILEELYFRNFIQKKLNEKYSNFIAIFISSLLFSLSHMDFRNILPSLALGIVSGIVFQKSNNIRYSIYIHSLHNFCALLVSYYLYNLDIFSDIKKYGINYWIITLTAALILYFSLKFFSKNIRKEKSVITN